MGEAKSGGEGQASAWGFKAVVFFYALAIVAIGAKPLFGNYDTLAQDAKRFIAGVRSDARKLRQASTDTAVAPKEKNAPSDSAAAAKQAEDAKLDHISPNDKKQLDDLLEKL